MHFDTINSYPGYQSEKKEKVEKKNIIINKKIMSDRNLILCLKHIFPVVKRPTLWMNY